MAAGWWNDYSYECEECDYSVSPRNERMIRVCWVFWISKHIEFFDTVRLASVRYGHCHGPPKPSWNRILI